MFKAEWYNWCPDKATKICPLSGHREDVIVKRRVLAAVVSEFKQTIDLLISGEYVAITYVHKFDDGVQLLRSKDYDLIICGVNSDDSFVLELLQSAKQMDRHRDTPFVVIKSSHNRLDPAYSDGIQLAVHEVGGAHYFDLGDSLTTFEETKFRVAQVLESLIDVGTALSLSRNSQCQKMHVW